MSAVAVTEVPRQHRREANAPTSTDSHSAAWAAGFFDGEGSTFALKPGRGRTVPRLRLAAPQAEEPDREGTPAVLLRLEAALGGNVSGPYVEPGNRRRRFVWHATGPAAYRALDVMRSYLSPAKQEQARRAIAACGGNPYGR